MKTGKTAPFSFAPIFCLAILITIIISFPKCLLADDDERHTIDVGNISVVVTNYGTVGLGFAEKGRLSCEYPIGSHIEHLYMGGLWVGGMKNNEIRVSTGAIDVSRKPNGAASGFEFTTGNGVPGEIHYSPEDSIVERSLLPTSAYYDPNATSHQDFICTYTDSNSIIPQTGEEIPDHRPLGITVTQRSYAWSQSFADAYIILDFTIKNTGSDVIQEPCVGYWIDTMVGNTDLNPPGGWAATSSWRYTDDGNNYIDSLQMGYEYDFDGDQGYAESYIGLRILGTTPAIDPDSGASFLSETSFYEWIFKNNQDPIFFMPQYDPERYDHMKAGLNRRPDYHDWRSQQTAIGPLNRSMLLATGPFPDLAPGDSINFVYAIVCANKYGPDDMNLDTELSKFNLFLNANWAKISYDGEDKNGNGRLDPGEDLPPYNGHIDRYLLPEAPPPPNMKLVAGDGKVDIYWDDSPESFIDPVTGETDFEGYKLYRARITQKNQSTGLKQLFELIGQFDMLDSVGYNTGLAFIRLAQPETIDGHSYQYKFSSENLLNGWQYAFAVTAFDMGDPTNNLPSLESGVLLSYGRAFPGPEAAPKRQVVVFPNPYKASSVWDGLGDDGVQERTRLLYFANLPDRCSIHIYTLAGDLVDTIEHDS
ncbi:MAG TPA: hypothetical protein DCZ43_07580, partial [candidate division Zixibacteria bacterium]|nr:hypothetical protein [candidate division Zixibacteria bacterium]